MKKTNYLSMLQKEDGFSFINLIEEINWDIRKYDFKSENLTFNPTGLIELDPAVYKSDMIMELDNIIVITEFQSTVVKNSMKKDTDYIQQLLIMQSKTTNQYF